MDDATARAEDPRSGDDAPAAHHRGELEQLELEDAGPADAVEQLLDAFDEEPRRRNRDGERRAADVRCAYGSISVLRSEIGTSDASVPGRSTS